MPALFAGPRARFSPRRWKVARTRRRLAERHLAGAGIEIGALHEPLAVPATTQVRYVDRLDLAGLRGQYPELDAKPLVTPDIVDDGERLDSVRDSSQDFVIANHFIEHCEDPIGTLETFVRVLRPGGVAYLAVPDRRRGIDAGRPATTFAHVQRDHEEGPTWSRHEHYREWVHTVGIRLGTVAIDEAEQHARRMEEGSYSIHFHAWDPPEFADLLERSAALYGLPMRVLHLVPNQHEFIVILRKAG